MPNGFNELKGSTGEASSSSFKPKDFLRDGSKSPKPDDNKGKSTEYDKIRGMVSRITRNNRGLDKSTVLANILDEEEPATRALYFTQRTARFQRTDDVNEEDAFKLALGDLPEEKRDEYRREYRQNLAERSKIDPSSLTPLETKLLELELKGRFVSPNESSLSPTHSEDMKQQLKGNEYRYARPEKKEDTPSPDKRPRKRRKTGPLQKADTTEKASTSAQPRRDAAKESKTSASSGQEPQRREKTKDPQETSTSGEGQKVTASGRPMRKTASEAEKATKQMYDDPWNRKP